MTALFAAIDLATYPSAILFAALILNRLVRVQ